MDSIRVSEALDSSSILDETTLVISLFLESLKKYLLITGLPPEDVSLVAGQFSLHKISKGDFFVQEGKISKYLGFLEKGFLQYYVNIEGVEKTTYSSGANNFVASLVSFLRQLPSKENIRAAVDSEIWVIDNTNLRKLQNEIPSFKSFYIDLLEWQICCIDESRLDAIMLNAQERYEKMLSKEPALIQQIPLQFLASILGITPRHLSRIRNKIRK